ncbi:MAG: hypothetical protein M1820_006459 [Bogoriella megaspora]|nr:MAG: hypothetical protein M1820_006459 [Bogoriella megaspora]
MANIVNALGVYSALLSGSIAGVGRAVIAPLTQDRPEYYKDYMYTKIRRFDSLVTTAQQQWYLPSTDATYTQIAKEQKFQPNTTILSDGRKAHWIGPKDAKKILLYFHGGGYILPCFWGHMRWIHDLTKSIQDQGHSFSAVILSYSLAPGSPYPTQLQQASTLLKHFLEVENRSPSDLIIGGDSAGGNLTLALLSHLLHPHPSVAPIQLNGKLSAAILISPWCSFDTTLPSNYTNEIHDVLAVKIAVRAAKDFSGGVPADAYTQASHAPKDWFRGLDRVVENVLVWGGGKEILIDAINLLVRRLKDDGNANLKYVIQRGAAHEDMILETAFGYTRKAEGTEVIEKFIVEKLR